MQIQRNHQKEIAMAMYYIFKHKSLKEITHILAFDYPIFRIIIK